MGTRPPTAPLAALLFDLCVKYGFCLPPADSERLMNDPPPDADAFTDAVFIAEGMDPYGNLPLRRLVKARVAETIWVAGEPGVT